MIRLPVLSDELQSKSNIKSDCGDNHQSSPPSTDYYYSTNQMKSLYFCTRNKIDVYSLEKRIDYHLTRIMKGHRLINFKNSIERLPVEKRICECIIEILMSTTNLIMRKTRVIINAKISIDLFKEFSMNAQPGYLEKNPKEFMDKIENIHKLSINLEQIVWALNSNKEHLRYIVKVYQIPEHYKRSEFQHDNDSIVNLKQSIINVVQKCYEIINVCRIIRQKMHTIIIETYLNHFHHDYNVGSNDDEQQVQTNTTQEMPNIFFN